MKFKIRHLSLLAAFSLFTLAVPAHAESDLEIAIEQIKSGTSTIADDEATEIVETDFSTITYSPTHQTPDGRTWGNDRNRAATAAATIAGRGEAVHAATSSIMMGTAAGWAGITGLGPAAAAMMAKARLEGWQAVADRKNKEKHLFHQGKIVQWDIPGAPGSADPAAGGLGAAPTNGSAGGETTAPTSDNPYPGLSDNPEFEKKLVERGINPRAFFEEMAAGGLNDTESILKAMGETSLSTEEIEKGQAMADAEAAKIAREQFEKETGGAADKKPADEENRERAIASRPEPRGPRVVYLPGVGYHKGGGAAARALVKGKAPKKPKFDRIAMIQKLLAKKRHEARLKLAIKWDEIRRAVAKNPEAHGVHIGKGTIFQIARVNFKGWGEWRRSFVKRFALAGQ